MKGTRGLGQDWEDAAERLLRREGYRILERNYRTKVGEIDFIAFEGDVLCFIEVKARRGLGFGFPEEAVTPEKQRRIQRAAEWFLSRRAETRGHARFDVVSIVGTGEGSRERILRGAFEGPPAPRRRR
ncbi:MAG: YraN family protein [Acidobacteriota bacterium]|nr:YraN family protein [Acidobacteriota bacterium]